MAQIKSNQAFLAEFFNQQGRVAAAIDRPTSRQEQLQRLTMRQRLGWAAVVVAGAAGLAFAADRALDNLAERQSPPAGGVSGNGPSAEEAVDNAVKRGVTEEAELSRIVEAADPRP